MKEVSFVDRRIQKTKHNLKTALVKLLETKKLEQITIVELTQKADVNRKTFYLHYTEIESVLKDIEREIYSKVKFLINSFDLKEANLEQFIFDLFSIVIENEHSRNLLLHTPYSKIITSSLEKALIEGVEKKLLVYEEMKSSTLKYTIAYHVFGSVRLFYSWIKSTQSADLSGFAKFLSSLVITGTKGLYGN